MWRPVVLILAVAVLAASLVASDDPWKDKPYKQWDAKDIQKIMTDSPWSHTVNVAAKWIPKRNMTTPKPATPPTTPPIPPDPTSIGENDSSNNRTLGGTMSGSVNYPVTSDETGTRYYVLWESSLTVRRASFMLTATPEERSRQVVTRQLDQYVISVHGFDMTPFSTLDEVALKQNCYLLTKKTNRKLTPDRIEIGATNSITFNYKVLKVSFYFSKKTATGEAVIPADEKQIEFACDTNLTRLKTSFDLTKMTGPNGADL